MPAIIDRFTWESVQARLRDNRRNACSQAKECYLLSGKIICGECGSTFVGNTLRRGEKVYSSYVCGKKNNGKKCDMPGISKRIIESAVIDQFADVCGKINVDAVASRLMEKFIKAEDPQEIKDARIQLDALEPQKLRIRKAILDGVPAAMLLDDVRRIEAEEKRLHAILDGYTPAEIPAPDDLKNFIKHFIDIREKTPEEQKKILQRAVKEIVIYKDKPPKITWSVPLLGQDGARVISTIRGYTSFTENLENVRKNAR